MGGDEKFKGRIISVMIYSADISPKLSIAFCVNFASLSASTASTSIPTLPFNAITYLISVVVIRTSSVLHPGV